ncbi:hypothetical protein MSAN_00549900 [Mycena sanguinolenta]|uniref:F-box domain-containing protein n=1 Tax=Mycena sanguinolenta TaxID=230812 RepID=A0A8H6Z6U9_9AGAR|nr:hypothetical protein MSAN_00549900 [Mycena sanguinolenta]
MTRSMLVSHNWLKIVLSVVFRDLWITSDAHFHYIVHLCTFHPFETSPICDLAGITHMQWYLTRTCRCLTVSVYHESQGDYADECAQLIEYTTTDSPRNQLFSNLQLYRVRHPKYAIPSKNIATFISMYTPAITTLHFVLIDCTATYRAWDMSYPLLPLAPFSGSPKTYPAPLVELQVTFAYTTPPPALLMNAPRGTFFPPPSRLDLPWRCCFYGVQRLVVRDANADFVAFLTTVCPRLQKVESTVEFSTEDVPGMVSAAVRDRLEFVRLSRTVDWGLTGSTDALPLPKLDPPVEQSACAAPAPSALAGKRRNFVWRFFKHAKYVLRGHK